jgi:hypothetical protein
MQVEHWQSASEYADKARLCGAKCGAGPGRVDHGPKSKPSSKRSGDVPGYKWRRPKLRRLSPRGPTASAQGPHFNLKLVTLPLDGGGLTRLYQEAPLQGPERMQLHRKPETGEIMMGWREHGDGGPGRAHSPLDAA